MINDQLTHRERIQLALQGEVTDRVPIAMVCSGFATTVAMQFSELLKTQRNTDLREYLRAHLDIRDIVPPYIGPKPAPGVDHWGVKRKKMYYAEDNQVDFYAEIDGPVLEHASLAEILAHPWPSTDWFDYAALPGLIERIQVGGPYCLMASNGNIFESSWFLRGFEQIFLDMALQPEIAHAIFTKVTDFYVAHFSKILEAANGEIDLVFTADDIGHQEGLLMSAAMWEEQLKPFHQRLNQVIHNYGAKVIYHSCGAVMELVPGLIDMGVDILQPLQFNARGMDPVLIKELHGDRLAFEGGVNVQKTLLGSQQEVRQEVEDLVRILGRGGGYILGPSHIIQLGTPPENILTMFETALEQPV